MQVGKNVAAAIAAAINLYYAAEQQAAAAEMMPVEQPRGPEAPRPASSPWALAGRQAAMEMRRMWQMRLGR